MGVVLFFFLWHQGHGTRRKPASARINCPHGVGVAHTFVFPLNTHFISSHIHICLLVRKQVQVNGRVGWKSKEINFRVSNVEKCQKTESSQNIAILNIIFSLTGLIAIARVRFKGHDIWAIWVTIYLQGLWGPGVAGQSFHHACNWGRLQASNGPRRALFLEWSSGSPMAGGQTG